MFKLKFVVSTLFVLFSVCSFDVCAKVVTIERATAIAEKFWNQHNTRGFNGNIQFSWDDSALNISTRTTGSMEKFFYVFESSQSNGFVIIAADDCIMPILGYSFEDFAPKPNNLPESMLDWLEGISKQIDYIRHNDIKTLDVESMWARADAGNVVLQLETARWNQHEPYNKQCPYDGNERSVAGCVPVAVAIVMRYHKWPEYGIGITESYYTETKGIYVESRDLNHKYNWDKMPLLYTHQGYSEDEANSVSTLMADIGIAFQADYTKESTSCYTNIKALYEHFGYNPGMSYVPRANYSDDIWLQMIKDDINSLRPVLYSGRSENNGGHKFVIDGYTDDNYFHINWGWGGVSNGYFTLSTLVPDDRGGYNDKQWACFNVKPCTSSEVEDWIKFSSPGIVISETNFEQNSRFYFDELRFTNITAVDFSGSFRGALTDRNGNIKEWITNELTYTLQNGGWSVRYSNVGAKITQSINIGDRIRFFYKSQDSNKWNLVKSSNEFDCRWEVLVADEYYISECTSFTFDKTKGIITLKTKEGVEIRMFTSKNEDVSSILSRDGNIIKIEIKELAKDVYRLELSKGNDIKVLEFSIKSN